MDRSDLAMGYLKTESSSNQMDYILRAQLQANWPALMLTSEFRTNLLQ